MKRFIAKVLVAATIVSAVDLTWLDLSGTGKAFAAAVEEATDSYRAYDELIKEISGSDSDSPGRKALNRAKHLGINIRKEESNNKTSVSVDERTGVQNHDDYTNTWNSNRQNSGSGVVNGQYVFRQQRPVTTAQLKSGGWLTQSNYEAMAGTPTTERLFITYGGNEYAVDLAYRFITAPYERTYIFNVVKTPNYRYYKLGGTNFSTHSRDLDYSAIMTAAFDKDPNKISDAGGYDNSYNNEFSFNNYAYKWFEQVRDSGDAAKDSKLPTKSASFPALNGVIYSLTYYPADGFILDSGVASSEKVASVKTTVETGHVDENGVVETQYTTPNVARAIIIKQQVSDAIKAYRSWWNGQDDNYRADQGSYDTDKKYYDSDDALDDKMTFMYTYGGMLRKGLNGSNEISNNNADGQVNKPNDFGSVWRPCGVSYFFDWTGYYDHNNMNVGYNSDNMKGCSVNNKYIYLNSIVSQLGGQTGSGSALANINIDGLNINSKEAFCVEWLNHHYYKTPQSGEDPYASLPLSMTYARLLAKATSGDACIAISDNSTAIAWGAPLKLEGSATMNMEEGNALGLLAQDDWGEVFAKRAGFNELYSAYYTALNALFLNYGGLFYKDELIDIFGTDIPKTKYLPGFPSSVSDAEYNQIVNRNLCALFGQPPSESQINNTHTITLPLALFPPGGDLDGGMDSSGNLSSDPVYTLPVYTSIPVLMRRGLKSDSTGKSYFYKVKFCIEDTFTKSHSTSATATTYYQTYHNNIPSNQRCVDAIPCPKCKGDGFIANVVTCAKKEANASKTFVNGSNSNTYNWYCHIHSWDNGVTSGSSKKYTCTKCGATYIGNVKYDSNTPEGAERSAKIACALCGSSHTAGDKTTSTNGTLPCPEPLKTHIHYWSDDVLNADVARPENHEDRKYKFIYELSASAEVTTDPGCWSSQKDMRMPDKTLKQRFENIQWLQIDSYSLYEINKGGVNGLPKLLGSTDIVNSQSVSSDILTKIVTQMGFNAYINKRVDPSELSVKVASGGIFSEHATMSNLSSMGIVANSLNINSNGNLDHNSDGWYKKVNSAGPGKFHSSNSSGSNTLTYNTVVARFAMADCPFIDSVGDFVNDDTAAFKVKDVSEGGDTITFEYNPMSQGGRSHSTFYNFVNQAFAHTLLFKRGVSGNFTINDRATSYSNSVRVQGDYLTLDKLDGNKLTLTGMFYDTWSEVASNNADGGKFSLIGKSSSKLSTFLSECRWIPGRMSVTFQRAIVSGNNIFSSNLSYIRCMSDCWMIHTYCQGINTQTHSFFDGRASGGVDCQSHGICMYGRASDMGNVSTDWNRGRGHDPGAEHILTWQEMQEGRSDEATVAYAGDTCTVKIPINNYLTEGKNTTDFMTSGVSSSGGETQVESGMPYVGYQTNGVGTKQITQDSSGESKGWDPGYETNFKPENAYIEGSAPKNFADFGQEVKGTKHNPSVDGFTLGRHSGSEDPYGSFSHYYPYLAGLNLSRYLSNAVYQSGKAWVVYNKIGEYNPSGHNAPTIRISGNRNQSPNEISFNTRYFRNNENVGGTKPEIGVHAGSIAATKNQLNNIVVYNPVSTQTASIVAVSKYLPDAGNVGHNSSGYNYSGKNSTYLRSFNNFIIRDTRKDTKYNIDKVEDKSGEKKDIYLTSGGISFIKTKVSDSTHLEYLHESKIKTTAYTLEDYEQVIRELKDSEKFESTGYNEKFDITTSGTYEMTKLQSMTQWVSSKVDLQQGDSISFSENKKAVILTMGSNNFELNWSAFTEAYKSAQSSFAYKATHDFPEASMASGLPLTNGMMLAVANGDMQLRKGSLIKLTLTVSNDRYVNSIAEEDGTVINFNDIGNNVLELDDSQLAFMDVHSKSTVSADGKKRTFEFWFEATSDTSIQSIPIKVNGNTFLDSFEGNALENEDVVLMSVGSGDDQEPVTGVTSYEFWHENTKHSESSTTQTSFYNTLVVDIRGESTTSYYHEYTVAGYYCNLQCSNSSVQLKNESLQDPHKVPNTDWRYYVLGWQLAEGGFITLNNIIEKVWGAEDGNVELIAPSGLKIKVSELDSRARAGTLAVYRTPSGAYGLLDVKEDGTLLNRESRYNGTTVTGTYDVESFADIGATTTINYTSQCMPTAWACHGRTVWAMWSRFEEIHKYSMEVVFRCTSSRYITVTEEAKHIAYEVRYSSNIAHKLSQAVDVINETTNEGKDWRRVEDTKYVFNQEAYSDTFAEFLSLDDEFNIYWDNYTDLPSSDSTSLADKLQYVSSTLGRGWNNNTEASKWNGLYTNNSAGFVPSANQVQSDFTKVSNTTAYHPVKDNDYWKNAEYDPNHIIDTTKWIYNKYVVFNTDMYAFTTEESYVYDDTQVENYSTTKWNPTTPAYNSNGKPNNIVYIPAGQKVYLGRYNHGSDAANEKGNFVDFGRESVTKSPVGLYYYHFWVPLSVGEADQTVGVSFIVNSYNGFSKASDANRDSIGKTKESKFVESTPLNANDGTFYNLAKSPVLRGLARKYKDDGTVIVNEWKEKLVDASGIVVDNNAYAVTDTSIVSDGGALDGKTVRSTYEADTVYKYYTRPINSTSSHVVSIAGRVGGLTIMDSGDPRYQDTFKKPGSNAEFAVAPIVRVITKYATEYEVDGSQRRYLTDNTNIRGRLIDKSTTTEEDKNVYKTTQNNEGNCYIYKINKGGSIDHIGSYFKDMLGTVTFTNNELLNNKSNDLVTNVINRAMLPLGGDFNIHKSIRKEMELVKLGYDLYCSIDTIGAYYGSLGMRYDESAYVNNNPDYGQTKLQIHPMYVAFRINPDTGEKEIVPVDVYMRRDGGYALINAGSDWPSADAAHGSGDKGPYYLDDCYDATYTSKISTNTKAIEDGEYVLDSEMLRRSITKWESKVTYDVVHRVARNHSHDSVKKGITTSILDRNESTDNTIGGESLTFDYVYGNAQMLFLREFNRTFVGGSSQALHEVDYNKTLSSNSQAKFIQSVHNSAQKQAQRWYFNLGLPSTAVFVPHGQDPTETTILNKQEGWYVATFIDTYAIGEKWAIHYESDMSGSKFTDDLTTWDIDEIGDTYENFPNKVPVNIYDIGDNSGDDKDSRGTH